MLQGRDGIHLVLFFRLVSLFAGGLAVLFRIERRETLIYLSYHHLVFLCFCYRSGSLFLPDWNHGCALSLSLSSGVQYEYGLLPRPTPCLGPMVVVVVAAAVGSTFPPIICQPAHPLPIVGIYSCACVRWRVGLDARLGWHWWMGFDAQTEPGGAGRRGGKGFMQSALG